MSKNNKKDNKKNKNNVTIEPINKNKALMEAKIKQMIKNGRDEITTIDKLKKYPIGSLISYINKHGIYKSGGFLWKISDDNFIYLVLESKKKIRVRMKNVDKIWVGSVYDVKNDVVSIIPTDKLKTSKPVMIGDVPIYYAKDGYDYNRFTCTNKYKLMEKWQEVFGDE